MKRIFAISAIMVLASSSLAFADEPIPTPSQLPLNLDLRVTDLLEGAPAPFTGILLTPDSLAKIDFDNKLSLQLLTSTHTYEYRRLQLRYDAEVSLRLSERLLHEELFASQLRRIESLEEIAISKRPDWVMPVAILTSFIVGAGVTVGITYAVNQ